MAWSSNLDSLEKVLRVYEELGGDAEEEIHDLVAVSRQFIRELDVFVKEAPFASSKKEKHRMYLFNDIMVIGKPVSMKDRKYKVTHFIGLKQCTFKDTPKADADGHFMVTLTQVSRHRVHPDGSPADPHDTHARIVTRIEKLEISFTQEKVKQEVMHEITSYLDAVEKEEHARRESAALEEEANAATGGDTPKKQRSWAKKRATLTKAKQNSVKEGHDDDESSVSGSVGGLSLSDLEARYSVDFQTPAAGAPTERAEFEICFGEGPMGFSLGSGPGVGVLVGRLAPGSFAEMGGVCIGDRVLFLENESISLNTTWQECVEKLKKLPRPVTITFERCAARQIEHDEHDDHHHHDTSSAPSAPAAEIKSTESSSSITEQKKRNWANRRAQRAANNVGVGAIISLPELEKVYKQSEEAAEKKTLIFDVLVLNSAEEKSCAAVLKEILMTERDYLDDLRALVREYILPLRRSLRRGKCKDLENRSKICEHNMIRSTCSRLSTEAQPMMDPEDQKVIFCNTETLLYVNAELLNHLEKGLEKVVAANKKPTLKDVASVYGPSFLHIMPFFKMYAVYCHNYSLAVQRLNEVRSSNHELHNFLHEREDKSQFTSLSSLLIKPVQRICKYPLLFAEVLKQFKKVSISGMESSVEDLKKAAQAVEEIAQSVNKHVGESEAMEKLIEAYEELGGQKGAPGLVEAHRRFTQSDDIKVHEPATDKEGEYKERIVYLFNDLLIIAKNTAAGGSGTLHKLSSSHSVDEKKERPRSLLRSWGSSGKSLTHALSRSKMPKKEQLAKVEHWLEIDTISGTNIEWKDKGEKMFGVQIKHIGRKTEEVKKTSTLGRHKSTTSSGSGKIITSVEKFDLWFYTQAERDTFAENLAKNIEIQSNLQAGQKKAEDKLSSTPKTQRSWTRKATRHDSSLSGGHGRTDSSHALSELEGKYKS